MSNSLLEWENKVAAVAVAGGCNWRCPYCHGWRYVTGLDDLEKIELSALFQLLQEQEGWLDGVVFSGGEPTLQPGLHDLVKEVKNRGLAVKIHTNGTRPEVIKKLLAEQLIDCLALDYKAVLDSGLTKVAGVKISEETLTKIRESFQLARESNIDREYHTTLCPQFINLENFRKMAEQLEAGGLWLLQQYKPDDCLALTLAGEKQFSQAELEEFAQIAGKKHKRVLLQVGPGR